MLDTNELRRRYRQRCHTCSGDGRNDDDRTCRRCDGTGTIDTMPRDVQLLCEEVDRLRTLLNEGDREGEGVCKRCGGSGHVTETYSRGNDFSGYEDRHVQIPCPECEKGAYP